MRNLLAVFLILVISGCGTLDVMRDPSVSIRTKVFAVGSDYKAAIDTGAAYVVMPGADPVIIEAIYQAAEKTEPAIKTLEIVASGDIPAWCGGAIESPVSPALTTTSCNGDLPGTLRLTSALVNALKLVIMRTEQ